MIFLLYEICQKYDCFFEMAVPFIWPSFIITFYRFLFQMTHFTPLVIHTDSIFFQIQSYFPGIIHVVYVIRPAGFFQKAISEVSSKFFKEDFKFRLMICSTLDDLFAHVERSQVTLDLGGELMYSHHEWIQQRIVSQVITKIVYQISLKINLSQWIT